MTPYILAIILLVAFQIKHLIADYYLQFSYMYENKGKVIDWFGPLLDHSLVHATFTFLIILSLFFTGVFMITDIFLIAVTLAAFDLLTHFITDRWKATRTSKPDESQFWINLGIDQMIHHLVGIIIVAIAIAFYVMQI